MTVRPCNRSADCLGRSISASTALGYLCASLTEKLVTHRSDSARTSSAQGSLLRHGRGERAAEQGFPELVHIDVDDRRGEKREQLRHQQPADDRIAERLRGRIWRVGRDFASDFNNTRVLTALKAAVAIKAHVHSSCMKAPKSALGDGIAAKNSKARERPISSAPTSTTSATRIAASCGSRSSHPSEPSR